jgi:integrase
VIRQRKDRDGLQVQVYAGRDPLTGRKRYVSRQVPGSGRAAIKQAKQVEAQLLAEVAAGKHQASGAMTLGQLLEEWIAWRESNGKPISPATLHNYRLTIDTKIKPALGHLPVTRVDARVLDRFYAALRKGGNARSGGGALSASRVRDIHAILSGALGLAARWNYIPFSPAVLARPPAAKSAARKLPTPEEAKAIMVAARERDPEFELFVRISASTGLRRGEVVALRWCDFDLDEGEIIVSGNVLFLRILEGGWTRKEPKSEHSERLLALDARTVELVRAHRVRRAEAALAAGVPLAEDSYLFTRRPDGLRPIRPDAMTRRFGRLAARLGHEYTLHGLRHFMATQLGTVAEAATVRARMGHGSLAVTSGYTHRVSAADRAAAEHMGRVLDEQQR